MEIIQNLGLLSFSLLIVGSVLFTSWRESSRLKLLVSGFAVLFISQTYPGRCDGDSLWFLSLAEKGTILDWHAPLLSFVYQYLAKIFEGPTLVLLLTHLAFWYGFYLLLWDRVRVNGTTVVVLLLLFFYPPNYSLLTQVSKHAVLCSGLILSMGLLFRKQRQETDAWNLQGWASLLLAIVSFILVANTRFESVFTIMLILAFYVFGMKGSSILKKITWIACTTLGIYLTNLVINQWVVTEQLFPQQLPMIQDLADFSLHQNQLLFPRQYIKPNVDINILREHYHYEAADYIGDSTVNFTRSKEDLLVLANTWLTQVCTHPFIYLQDRYTIFLKFIGLDGCSNSSSYMFVQSESLNELPSQRFYVETSTLSTMEGLIYHLSRNVWIFRPVMVLPFCLIAGYFMNGCSKDIRRMVCLLMACGFVHVLSFFPIVPGLYFRYGHWGLFACSLAVAFCLIPKILTDAEGAKA